MTVRYVFDAGFSDVAAVDRDDVAKGRGRLHVAADVEGGRMDCSAGRRESA
jgi:hypothetical protein